MKKNMHKEKKKHKKNSKKRKQVGILFVLIGVLLILVFGFGEYQRYKSAIEIRKLQQLKEASSDNGNGIDTSKILPEYRNLYKTNSDLVGWLVVNGTQINYPVVQSTVYQEFYLDHNFDGENDESGAVFADARNDVITTSVVLIAAVLTQVTGFARLDGLMGIAVSLFILYSGAMLVKDTIDPLLGSAPDPELVRHIEDKALSYPGVLGVHDLMIHDYGPGNRLVSFHVEMDANADVMYSHDVIDRIERDLLNQDDLVATIHFDPVIASDSHVAELRSFLQQEVASLDTRANIHDLRIVPGPTHTNVIFDCAVPAEYITEKQRRGAKLAAALRAAVERKWPDHFCIIKLEPDYSAGIHETK